MSLDTTCKPFPQKKYNIIYADPPWTYTTWSHKGKKKSAACHYDLMTNDEINALPVQEIAADDCVLLLWATYPCLQAALDTIKAWGFSYKTVAFTWVKKNKKSDGYFWGLGYWTRANAEICLLATKGHPKRAAKNVHSVVDTPVEEHSKKPNVVRERIVQLLGDVPRIELFARQRVNGWDAWGKEIE